MKERPTMSDPAPSAAMIEWGVLFERIVGDVAKNRPPPAPTQPPDVGAAATAFAAKFPAIYAQIEAHQGVITAVYDAADAFAKLGLPGAAEARDAMTDILPALDMLKSALPEIAWMARAFKAAPTGIVGDHPT